MASEACADWGDRDRDGGARILSLPCSGLARISVRLA